MDGIVIRAGVIAVACVAHPSGSEAADDGDVWSAGRDAGDVPRLVAGAAVEVAALGPWARPPGPCTAVRCCHHRIARMSASTPETNATSLRDLLTGGSSWRVLVVSLSVTGRAKTTERSTPAPD